MSIGPFINLSINQFIYRLLKVYLHISTSLFQCLSAHLSIYPSTFYRHVLICRSIPRYCVALNGLVLHCGGRDFALVIMVLWKILSQGVGWRALATPFTLCPFCHLTLSLVIKGKEGGREGQVMREVGEVKHFLPVLNFGIFFFNIFFVFFILFFISFV